MFDFEQAVKKYYGKKTEVISKSLKDIYNAKTPNEKCKKTRGRSTEETKGKGVYALYLNNELKKIGRAITGNGIFDRMSQYYRLDKAGSRFINDKNKNDILVYYFKLNSNEECWIAEKRLQVCAYDLKEKMPWDEEVDRNDK